MLYFTAVFGEVFVRKIVVGLLRSFRASNPTARLIVFCDEPAGLAADLGEVECRPLDLAALLAPYDADFYQGARHRTNVFKFSLLQLLSDEFPGETFCWLDADSLVLDDLSRFFRPGRLNVVSHGRRDREVVDCGNGLYVPGTRFVIGGTFAVPAGDCCRELVTLAKERPHWSEHGYWPGSGDQIAFNHLVQRYYERAHYLCDDERYIFNASFHDGLWPMPGDPGLLDVHRAGAALFHGQRRFVVLQWVSSALVRHLNDDFSSFDGGVRDMMRGFYA